MAKKLVSTRYDAVEFGYPHVCKECGKTFFVADPLDYVYRSNHKTQSYLRSGYLEDWFCCYSHWRNNGGAGGNEEYRKRLEKGTLIKHKQIRITERGVK